MTSNEPQYPLTVTFEDGEKESYEDQIDLECNLEFFDSNKDVDCSVKDALNKDVYLILDTLVVKELRYK